MERCSLHFVTLEETRRYTGAVIGARQLDDGWSDWDRRTVVDARRGYAGIVAGGDRGLDAVTLGLARYLAARHPSYVFERVSLTAWEARIDRGIGMLMRPPSRLFADAGMPIEIARRLPIRLELAAGLMGGSWIPGRLMADAQRMLDERAERLVRRVNDAEMDGVAIVGLLMQAVDEAERHGCGLFEAIDAIEPSMPETMPPGAIVMEPSSRNLPKELRMRLELAAKPPKKPGLMARLRGGRSPRSSGVAANGHGS